MQTFPSANIDLSALAHNYQQLKALAPNAKVLAIVKANAYGHGIEAVCRALTHCDGFGFARIDEALVARQLGVTNRLLLLEGVFTLEDLLEASQHNIDVVVHHQSQIEMLEQLTLSKPITVWLKVDTGMHRLGFQVAEAKEAFIKLKHNSNVAHIEIMSHFACSDEISHPLNQAQLDTFTDFCQPYNTNRSLANSAALLTNPASHFEWVRPGIALYGISPMTDDLGQEHGLIPVMTLKSQLIAVRNHKKGEPVGYGATWKAQQDTVLGVVAIGYGDGYPRDAPTGTPVWINGRLVPIVGRVSMDMLTVDLGANATDQCADTVELWGKNLPIEKVAKHIGVIVYELMTKLTPRVTLNIS